MNNEKEKEESEHEQLSLHLYLSDSKADDIPDIRPNEEKETQRALVIYLRDDRSFEACSANRNIALNASNSLRFAALCQTSLFRLKTAHILNPSSSGNRS
jgi:hypothetical protein